VLLFDYVREYSIENQPPEEYVIIIWFREIFAAGYVQEVWREPLYRLLCIIISVAALCL